MIFVKEINRNREILWFYNLIINVSVICFYVDEDEALTGSGHGLAGPEPVGPGATLALRFPGVSISVLETKVKQELQEVLKFPIEIFWNLEARKELLVQLHTSTTCDYLLENNCFDNYLSQNRKKKREKIKQSKQKYNFKLLMASSDWSK